MTEMVPVHIHDRWKLLLPDHRAKRPEWSWWEAARLCAMHHHLKPGNLIFDVGSEEGDLSALYALWGCRVLLCEPNPLAWPNTRAIFETNQLTDRVSGCWPAFVGSPHDETDWPCGGVMEPWPSMAHEEIRGDHGFLELATVHDNPPLGGPTCTTVDRLAGRVGLPDAITIDVEGAELRVLRGAHAVLEAARPVVFVSVHPREMIEQYHDSPAGLHAFMSGLGYEDWHLATDHEAHHMFVPKERA